MGRKVRRVPPDWQHPRKEDGHFQPMHDRSYRAEAEEWTIGWTLWQATKHPSQMEYPEDTAGLTFTAWHGEHPDERYYMPEFPEGSRTHYQMYEDTSEGTPISPVMETPEKLARWLADNGASSFGDLTATYDQWLSMIKAGWAVSAVLTPGREMISGVELSND